MTSKDQSIVWIKKPKAVFADNAEGGVVIQGQKIVELIPKDQSPKSPIDEVYDAGDSVLCVCWGLMEVVSATTAASRIL